MRGIGALEEAHSGAEERSATEGATSVKAGEFLRVGRRRRIAYQESGKIPEKKFEMQQGDNEENTEGDYSKEKMSQKRKAEKLRTNKNRT